VLVELGFETLEQGEGVGGTAGESGQDLFLIQPPDLACGGLDDDVAEGDLAVAAEGDFIAPADGKNGGAAILFHGQDYPEKKRSREGCRAA
jgi:hypothetical protein